MHVSSLNMMIKLIHTLIKIISAFLNNLYWALFDFLQEASGARLAYDIVQCIIQFNIRNQNSMNSWYTWSD